MVNQWIIYDTYEQHEIEKEKFEERERKKGRLSEHEGTSDKGKNSKKEQGAKSRDEIDKIISEKFMKAAKILERMVNQGIYDQVIKGVYDMKLKYWRLSLSMMSYKITNSKPFAYKLHVFYRFQVLH